MTSGMMPGNDYGAGMNRDFIAGYGGGDWEKGYDKILTRAISNWNESAGFG